MDDRADTNPLPNPAPTELSGDDSQQRWLAWVAAARVDEAARSRARQRWLERQAREEVTLGGLLLDRGERAGPVVVSTRRRTLRGVIRAVGADFTVVGDKPGGDVLVPFRSIDGLRSVPGEADVGGDRPFVVEVVMTEALVELAVDQPEIWLLAARDEVRGRLRSSGVDVVTVVTPPPSRATVHVPHAAIDHVVILNR